jgi:8-oxo-dGTP pyrophosphatase MutT (NUDIX family)
MQKYNIFSIYNMSAKDTQIRGAGCLLWIEHNGRILVLTGKESVYLNDTHKQLVYKGEPVSVESKQQYTIPEIAHHLSLPEKLTNVKQMYGSITERFERENQLGQRIQFDTPEITGDNQYHCNFRILPEEAKRGICKGRREATDASTRDTAQRELKEETGMVISRTGMAPLGVFLGYEMFQSNLGTIMGTPQASYDEVLRCIQSREIKKYGELFKVSLTPLDTVIEWVCNDEYNAVSKAAICEFVQSRGTPEQKARINDKIGSRSSGRGKKSRGKKSRGKRSSKGKQSRSKK